MIGNSLGNKFPGNLTTVTEITNNNRLMLNVLYIIPRSKSKFDFYGN